MALCRLSVALVLAASIGVALIGENAYDILEASYAIGLVGLFVPFVAGIYDVKASDRATIAAMVTGMLVWSISFLFETVVPMSLVAVAACGVVFEVLRRRDG